MLVLVGGVVAFVVFLGIFIYSKKARKLDGIPEAPNGHWYFGHVKFIADNFQKQNIQLLLDWAVEAALANPKQPYSVGIPDKNPIVRITTPEAAKFILNDRFDIFIKIDTPLTKAIGREFFGSGIFASDGDDWSFQRKTASHMFSTNVLKSSMSPVFLEHGESVVGLLEEYSKSGKEFDIQALMKRFTMDSICNIAFGAHFNSIHKEKCEFSESFDRIQELIVSRSFKPAFLFYFDRWARRGEEGAIAHDTEVIDGVVYDIIKQREERLKDKVSMDDGKWDDLLSQFILQKQKKGESLDPVEARDTAMNFLIAGRDTTACLLTWTFYELSKRPEMEERILEEMREAFQDEPVSAESVKKLVYTENFMSEVLRLHPPVPFDAKRVMDDVTFPDGTFIPKYTQVQYSPYIYGRMPWIWDNPEEFTPERWEKDPNPSDYKFLTFNAGPRLCLGKRMAYLEAKILLSLVLPDFKVNVVKEQSFQPARSIILWFNKGLNVTVTPRD